jgi:hypothetical protein
MSNFHRILTGITLAVAAAGALGTVFLYSLVVFRGGYAGMDYLLFWGAWGSWPYGVMAVLALSYRRHLPGALVIFLGVSALTVYGLFGLHEALHPYLTPPALGRRVENCAGPILELMLTIFQGVGLGIVGGFAAFLQAAFTSIANAAAGPVTRPEP